MARSRLNYVYVVTDGSTPIAAFPVKYELCSYLKEYGWFDGAVPWEVFRFTNHWPRTPGVPMTKADFKPSIWSEGVLQDT